MFHYFLIADSINTFVNHFINQEGSEKNILPKTFARKRQSVTSQKGETQNGCFKKIKKVKFSEKRTFLTPPRYAYVRIGGNNYLLSLVSSQVRFFHTKLVCLIAPHGLMLQKISEIKTFSNPCQKMQSHTGSYKYILLLSKFRSKFRSL